MQVEVDEVGVFLRTGFISLHEEAKKLARHLGGLDVVDYEQYRALRPPPYYPRHMVEEWYRKHKLKKYRKAVFIAPFQRIEVAKMMSFKGSQDFEKVIWYTVTEGISLHMEAYARRLRSEIIATPSRFSKEMIELVGGKVDYIIPHQAEEPLIIDDAFGRRWREKYPKSKKLLVYIGNPVARKGLIELREAIDILARRRGDFHVVLHTCNQPNLAGYDVNILKHPRITLELEFGLIPKSQALAKMKYADYYIHPAKGEGFGLPVLEALQLGKPLVCIDAFGVNEIANPKCAWMCPRKGERFADYPPRGLRLIRFKEAVIDPVDLADTIDQALSASKEEIEEKRARGFEVVKRFKNTYDRFRELLLK